MIEGRLLGERYLIKKMIGGGGMANVYLAQDTILNREVAIKVLRLEYANDEEFIARFDREAHAATSLAHPNIVSIYDVGEEANILYMVMEYVHGLTLKEYIQKYGPVEVEEALDIMKQISSAIAHAHANDLVHRDIKPQNILIDTEGNVKVTDFGIAIALSATSLTQTNAILGSVHYLSPEQARGGMATKKSDVYSLGIVLYELLTGKLPFSGQTPVSIALKHLQSDTPSVRRMDPTIPQSVENIVLKATAKDPFHRYASIEEIEEAVETALDPNKMNEDIYTPPFEVGEETKAIPIITDDHLNGNMNDETIVHTGGSTTIINEKKNQSTTQNGKKKKNRKRRIWIFSIVVLLLISLSIAALLLLPKWFQTNDVVIPDVTNKTYEEAIDMLEERKLKGEHQPTFSEDVEEGLVVKTDPKAGRTVKEGSVVKVLVSEGKEKLLFSDYVGKDFDQVKKVLEESGYDVSFRERHSDRPAGEILDHIFPQVGAEVIPSETKVYFEISSGPEQKGLPNLKGLTEKQASSTLKDLGLKMKKINTHSNNVEKGYVIEHDPDANEMVKKGDTIDVYISAGPEDKRPVSKTIHYVVPFIHKEEENVTNAQKVTIYIEDMNNNLSEVYKEEFITKDKEFTFTLTIEPGKEATYKIMRDDETIEKHTISYEEGE